ncbi:MAG: hypothetical protein LBP59_09860, partial [Planctomycetaceae bacterium]|nr:hypothetical protein [Planctomycetaceae bacterium]
DALTQYDFRLTATNANGSRNSITTATTKVLLPTPQNLRAESNGKTAVALDWNNVAGASEYILQREISAGNWTQIYKGLDSKFVDKNLTAGTEYSYRVQAVGSDFSDAVKVKTLATDVADVPIIITSEIDVDDKVKLEWTDLGSEYYYYVFRNGSLLSAGQQNTIYVDNKPLTGIHEYYVYAYNENTGKWSNALPVVMVADTIKSKVDAEIFSHEISPDGKIELNWSPINNAQQIIIFRNGVPVSTILGSQDTTWTDQSPNNNKNNEYVIYVGYLDDFNRTNWTWSSPYVVKKATTTSPSTAAIPIPNTDIFNEFWANYDL